jgi:hypothetical protein
MGEQRIWICFDLGARGDLDGLYTWLDAYDAKECGENTSVLKYEYTSDLIKELGEEIKKNVELDARSRIYVIHETISGGMRGQFIIGNRKPAPWYGFAEGVDIDEDYD